MSKLFEPLSIRSLTLKNRIVVSPMCQYSSRDGFANDWHLVHLGSRAVGGAGLIITEACAVSPEGRISPQDLGIWKDEHIEQLKKITAFIEAQGSIAGIQLAHAGRKASCSPPWLGGKQLSFDDGGWQVSGPANIPFREGTMIPVAMSKDDILQMTEDFKKAATRALAAGFKVIELHGAHGYLLHEFFSPLSNNREDEYGGSFENRTRILFEIIDAVRSVWPSELPLFVRISATDWVEGGWDLAESVKLSAKLRETGAADVIDCSSGGNASHAKVPVGPGYQVPFSKAIREQTGILTGAVGMITGAAQAEEILNKGEADLIIMAREFLRDPYFPLRAAGELGDDIKWPLQYERAKM
jgi:2,4-dienoyl-CoA reductase-like NADH-dependent reductase (Old Yellow Enzyme family)